MSSVASSAPLAVLPGVKFEMAWLAGGRWPEIPRRLRLDLGEIDAIAGDRRNEAEDAREARALTRVTEPVPSAKSIFCE